MSGDTSLDRPLDDGHCFGCGPYSTIGLKMRFDDLPDGTVESRLTLAQPYQGWRGVAHGGIVALLLDEGMAYAAAGRGHLGVTAELTMRFRKPVPLGEPLIVRGGVLWERRGVLGIEAAVSREDGALLASGEGRFVVKGKLEPGRRLGRPDGDR
jgi:acyl-coenzyme A thioesterase PaaI-like protein